MLEPGGFKLNTKNIYKYNIL